MSGRLFDPIVPEDKLHPSFIQIRDASGEHPGRAMMEEIFAEYEAVDENFLDQFQTTGFNARCFELYLFALFRREQYALDRSHESPDFIVQRNGCRVAVEATTVNPPISGALKDVGKRVEELSFAERLEYEKHELAIRFGSPLFSKLQKLYWELDHCRGLPFVLAIQAFHDEHALTFSENALTRYLYGLDQTTGSWDPDGSLKIHTVPIDRHTIEEKSIPSNFFGLPGAEHISAVVFTNSGSMAKFDRIGFHHGYGNDTFIVQRLGTALNPNRDAMDATLFIYDVGQPPFVEAWNQGLVVNHNPNALVPLPGDFFGPVINARLEDGRLVHDAVAWHPFSSKTLVINVRELKAKLPPPLVSRPLIAIEAIPREYFVRVVGYSYEANELFEEQGWFVDATESFVGVVLHDKADDEWTWVILARDPRYVFRAIETGSSAMHRREACQAMQQRMAQLVMEPKRIFVQD